MSAIVKTKLKAARDAISKKEWEKAKTAASDVLEYDIENYNANVFLGLALLELGETKLSEQTYLKATSVNRDQPLAWQGLSKLYENVHNWEEYGATLHRLAEVHAKAQDATKCAEYLQKLLDLRRKRGTLLEIAETLGLFLLGSPFYSVISELPLPDATNPTGTTTFFAQSAVHNSLPLLEEIISITEQDEERTFVKEVNSARQRTGAKGLEETQREVGRKLWTASKLPPLYQEVLNHPNASDELRRTTEANLLSLKQKLLYALPHSDETDQLKKTLRQEVQEMVNGIVLLEIPNELAWTLYIEGKDAATIEDYDYELLLRFTKLFTSSGLSKLLQAYFTYRGISSTEGVGDAGETAIKAEDEDCAAVVMDLFPNASNSLLGHRCVGDVYLHEEDFESVIKVAESGLELYAKEVASWGAEMPAVKRTFNAILAISLVHHYPPKHHTRALHILDEVLAEDGDNMPCLMSRGYIMEYANKWDEAARAFQHVMDLAPDDILDGLRAREEYAWCMVQSHDSHKGERMLVTITEVLDREEGRERDKARSWLRLGKARWDLGDKEAAYRCFITALKRFPSHAPAFTSLGIYYLEVAIPPDPSRASKCFQKAFELDPRETDAAQRLAQGFAEEREWDLVEVVARRTIDGEGGLEGGSETVTPPRYQPLNAWAWKALGVVELNRQRYPQAIQAFQVALRTYFDDQLCWLRLGEAYNKAGRYAAALKALERARELDPNDWISSYFLGEVKRQMGQFQEAITTFVNILEQLPSELRVLLSLGQCHLEFGRAQLASGYQARAEASFLSSIEANLESINTTQGFRRISWKIVADALFELARLPTLIEPDYALSIVQQILSLITDCSHERISNVISFPITLVEAATGSVAAFILETAVAAYDYRISLGSLDDIASASAQYDLGAALCILANRRQKPVVQEASHKMAISCLKEALKLSPMNARYWTALGNALFIEQPKTAQHAYIRALEIDNKDVSTWSNLGFLYLHHGDTELANKAFYKAQVLDPDFASAWIGQGLAATLNGHHQEALTLFEHSTRLPVPIPEADVAYARRLFNGLGASRDPYDITLDAFSPAFFVLDRFRKQRPHDANAQHLFGLVCERIGHLELAASSIAQSITLLEAEYEETEDSEIEQHFTIAHSNLARIHLTMSDYIEVQGSCQTVLGLLEETEELSESHISLVTQTRLYSGLASLKTGDLEGALESLETSLSTAMRTNKSEVQGHLVVLIAQILWASNTEEAKDAAKDRLLTSITTNPNNLTAVNILAGMGILTDDASLVDAALSEILEVPIDERLSRDSQRDVTYLLVQHHLAQGDVAKALSIAKKAVVTEPTQWKARERLAFLQLQRRERTSAQALLSTDVSATRDRSPLRERLPLAAVAEADAMAAQKLAQKAVILAPWNNAAWRALAYARSCCMNKLE